MVIYYENSKGEKLNLLKYPYRTVEADWFDADWSEGAESYEKQIDIDVFGNRSELQKNMETLYRILATDPETDSYGRLYVNGSFLRCRIKSSKKSGWKGYVYATVQMTFEAPELVWIEEISKGFYRGFEGTNINGLDFPTDFAFDFAPCVKGNIKWQIDHITSSDFQMIIYGPVTNPKITVNNWLYEVKSTLLSGEYLVIDSVSRTLTKFEANGTAKNIFNERGYVQSVFQKIPSGMLTVEWNGEFGFDITLFLRRREAKW